MTGDMKKKCKISGKSEVLEKKYVMALFEWAESEDINEGFHYSDEQDDSF